MTTGDAPHFSCLRTCRAVENATPPGTDTDHALAASTSELVARLVTGTWAARNSSRMTSAMA